MKLKYIINFAVIILILNGINCKEKPTESPIDEFPPGYQHDIPWPSLADSPWPLNHADPQNTGRSKYKGPNQGILEKIINTDFEVGNGAVADLKNIYFTSSGNPINKTGLYKYNFTSENLTHINNKITYYSTPLLASNNRIYHLTYNELIALDSNQNIIWNFTIENGLKAVTRSVNIDLKGYIYFITTENILFCIDKNGNEIWRNSNNKFYWSSLTLPVFSIDAKTLYINGNSSSLIAIDANNGNIKWEFGLTSQNAIVSPVVDSYDNIYIISKSVDSSNSNSISFYSISKNGNINWEIPLNGTFNCSPTIDKKGNIYIASDTLYSINYEGKINFKKNLGSNIGVDLVTDVNNNIYVFIDNFNLKGMVFSNNGETLWNLEESVYGFLVGSPVIINDKIIISTSNSKNLYIIK